MAVLLTQEAAGAYQTQKALVMTFSKYSFEDLSLNLIIEDSHVQISKQISLWVHQIQNLHQVGDLFCMEAQLEAVDDSNRSIIKTPCVLPGSSNSTSEYQTICFVRFEKNAMLVWAKPSFSLGILIKVRWESITMITTICIVKCRFFCKSNNIHRSHKVKPKE